MPLIRTPQEPPETRDPRTVEHAYIRCGDHLYYVLGDVPGDRLDLEDAFTLTIRRESCENVRRECSLVRISQDRL